jgi:predicted XRE-type DNA-binding protein
MPKKRTLTSSQEALAQIRSELGAQSAQQNIERDQEILGHVTRTTWMYEISHGRKAKKLTQQQLADLCGVPQPEISRLEGGLANPTLDTMVKLMVALDLEMALVPQTYKLPKH